MPPVVHAAEIVHRSCETVVDLNLVRKTSEYRINLDQRLLELGYKVTRSSLFPKNQAKPGELILTALPFGIIKNPDNQRFGCKYGVEVLERAAGETPDAPQYRDVTGVLSAYSEFSCTAAVTELIATIPFCRISRAP